MRMAFADTDPNDLRRALWRKRADTGDRKKKGAKLDGCEFFTQHNVDIFGNAPEEAEREMHLIALTPTNAAQVRIKTNKCVAG